MHFQFILLRFFLQLMSTEEQEQEGQDFQRGWGLTPMKIHTDELGRGKDLPVGQHDIEVAFLAFLHGPVSH